MRIVGTMLSCALLIALPAGAVTLEAQAECSNTSATVTINSVEHSCPDQLDADGSWTVSNADGVQLNYFVDEELYQEEDLLGSSGSWIFGDIFDGSNGTYEFTVNACPRVWNGTGYTVCNQHCATDTQSFTVGSSPAASITGCFWDCDFNTNDCTGTCEGTATGGESPYRARWGVQGSFKILWEPWSGYQTPPFNSPELSCTVGDDVYLEVEDSCGSRDRSGSWPCGFN